MFVYDVTEHQSLSNLRNWLSEFEDLTTDQFYNAKGEKVRPPVLVVANKVDLVVRLSI